MRKKISQAVKDTVANRANFCCEYCLALMSFSSDPFCIEHIIPLSKEGSNDITNLAFCCSGCNSYKYNHTQAIDPLSGQQENLFHPRLDKWDENFIWNNEKTIIIGKTPKGRATVERLKLNREGLQNQRELLFKFGKHPPK